MLRPRLRLPIHHGIKSTVKVKITGACYEIAIDGMPRSYRDRKELAIEAATFLKTKNVHSEVTVRDLGTGETIAVKHPLAK
jgi:electron transfer flavoprotein alpha/beta subunit